MKTVKVPPITLGIDMLSDETSIPKGAVRDATNIDISRVGQFSRRKGYTRVVSGSGWHSLRAFPQQGLLLVAQNATLKSLNPSTYATTDIFTLNSPEPLDYCEHNGTIYFANKTTIGQIPSDTGVARRLGVRLPGVPTLSATTGNLDPGKYIVTTTLVDAYGEESGWGGFAQIELPSGGGITLSNMEVVAGHTMRIYVTGADGERLYLNHEKASAATSTIKDRAQLKALEDTYLAPMPSGSFVRAFNGRLLVGEGDMLYFSEPLRYGAYDPSYGWQKFNGPLTFVEPVVGGVFVGAGTRVWFLAGGDISKAKMVPVLATRAIPNSSMLIPAQHLPDKMVQTDYPVALWLSAAGYVLGLPDGSVKELQADRVRVPSYHVGRTAFLLRNGQKQVVTPVNSSIAAAYGTAVDSTT